MIAWLKSILRKVFKKKRIDIERLINKSNKGVINFIDIGSAGILPFPWKTRPGVIRNLLKFEPREEYKITDNVIRISAALWDKNEVLPFYIYKGLKHTGSSLFKPNFQFVESNFEELKKKGDARLAETWFDRSELVREETLNCKRLVDVLLENGISIPYHFMKIDAQGAEFEILKGAESLLKSDCLGLHLELFTLPLYVGITLSPEVSGYLSGLGFQLVKKFEAHGSFASQHDYLFLKSDGDKEVLSIIKNLYQIS